MATSVPERVVIVGAGAAGTAAAWLAARRACEVTLLSAQAGSSSLSSGALDFDHGPELRESWFSAADAELREFVAALGLWRLGRSLIATRQGVLRHTLGHDLALLDLEPLAGRRIALADVERDDWDARGVAATLGASDWARLTHSEFTAVPVPACRRGAERRISAYDFALLHEHPERLGWLGELLRARSPGQDAWLLGPWLGIDAGVAERLRERVGLPLGEVSSPPGGPAGA
ncbi:MAG TPA: FAD-dependent oxidoreductase, partial [Polyangiaceae bacterium]|nr:FAD-dependent oxidoreductase [Polyangiaceae bacterium]